MDSIRFLDRFKLYEDQSGMMSYAERAVRKAVNILERSYCNHLEHRAFEMEKNILYVHGCKFFLLKTGTNKKNT